jgi:sec-independent protein translocase protein TatA
MIYPLLFAGLGPKEIIAIVLIIVLLFGAKKIPELMRGMGRGVKEFKDAVNGDGIVSDKDEEKNEEKK